MSEPLGDDLGTAFFGGKVRPRRRARDADDFYPTVAAAPVRALIPETRAALERALAVAPAAGRAPVVLDPCCGAWHLMRPVCAAGYAAVGCDLHHPARRNGTAPAGATSLGARDFLAPGVAAWLAARTKSAGGGGAGAGGVPAARAGAPYGGVPAAIVMNPPFKQAEAFLRACLRLRPGYLAALLPAEFFHAPGRVQLFRDAPPALELKITKRIDWTGEGNPTQVMSWWVWHGPAAAPFARRAVGGAPGQVAAGTGAPAWRPLASDAGEASA